MAIDNDSKKAWIESYRGATLQLPATFGNPKVNHMFLRNFDIIGRNAFFISVRGRVLLGEEQISQAEKHIYDRIDEVFKTLDRKIEAARVIMVDAGIEQIANYNKPTTHPATIVSPMQTRYVKLLEKADELLKFMSTLMLHGEITEREHSKRELEIKHHMRVVPSAVRKVTIGLHNRLKAQAGPEVAGESAGETVPTAEDASPVAAATPAVDVPAEAVAEAA